ncbi:hypothetical protein Poly41_43050 [Novipirellula artificiosorum]|uniref:Uncharacterized protein n=1 Tax=Novipirellula artificiosorum TaxID=2528016 RepID=A0A5C6DJR8_9BACT|nr:hypothetical protein Poly41_43050 [Novipirellula artificiosorum]
MKPPCSPHGGFFGFRVTHHDYEEFAHAPKLPLPIQAAKVNFVRCFGLSLK